MAAPVAPSLWSPSDQASLNLCSMHGSLRGLAWRFLFFAGLQWKSSKYVCQSLFFACGSEHCVSLTCIECVGNVCEVATGTRLFRRSSPQPTSHLHKSYSIASSPQWPSDLRSQCLCRSRSENGKPKILLPFDQRKGVGFQRWKDRQLASFASDRKQVQCSW